MRTKVRKITSLPCTVVNTHYHWDHIGGNILYAECAIHESEMDPLAQEPDLNRFRQAARSPATRAVLPSSSDPAAYRVIPKPATRTLQDNDVIDLGECMLRVIHTPGNSLGHVAYFDDARNMLVTGDTAYLGPVYACFEGSDPVAFAQSVQRLACPGRKTASAERTASQHD